MTTNEPETVWGETQWFQLGADDRRAGLDQQHTHPDYLDGWSVVDLIESGVVGSS